VKTHVRTTLGFLLSAGFLWLALRGVTWHAVLGELRTTNYGLLALSSIAATGIFPLRARRWRPILDPVAPNLPFGPLWRSTAIGMMVNNVVPARAGELARAYALTREVRTVPFSTVFASLAVDRVFDAVVVLALMFGAMLDPAFPHTTAIAGRSIGTFAIGGIAVLGGALFLLYLLVLFPGHVIGVYEAFARRVAPSVEEHGRRILHSFASGLSVLRSPRRFLEVLWWAVLHWLLNAFAFWLAFKAVGITAPFSAALFLQGIISIGVAIPSSPGFFGVFETAAKVGLVVYGITEAPAITWAVGFHLISFIPITVIGAYYFGRVGLSFGELRSAGATEGAAESA
jgi:uncharacterized protein (TIRG00374 family)